MITNETFNIFFQLKDERGEPFFKSLLNDMLIFSIRFIAFIFIFILYIGSRIGELPPPKEDGASWEVSQ